MGKKTDPALRWSSFPLSQPFTSKIQFLSQFLASEILSCKIMEIIMPSKKIIVLITLFSELQPKAAVLRNL